MTIASAFPPPPGHARWLRLIESTETRGPDSDEMIAQLARIVEGVNTSTDIETMLEAVVAAIVEHSPWNMCWVGLVDPGTKEVKAAYLAGMPDPAAVYGPWQYAGTPSELAIDRDEVVVYRDVLEDAGDFPQFQAEAILAGCRSMILLPIRLDRGWRGVLQLTRADPHEVTALEMSVANIVASFAAVAFRNFLARIDAVDAERVANAQLREYNAVITRQKDTLHALSRAHERLLQTQLHAGGFDAQCAQIADVIQHPVLLLDRFGQTVSSAGMGDDTAQALGNDLRQGWEKLRRLPDRAQVLRLGDRTLMVSRVTQGGELLAIMAVPCEADAATDERLRVLEMCGLHVALEILQQRASIDAEMRLEQDFADALQAVEGGEAALSKRAGMLGVRLDRPFVVLRSSVSLDRDVDRRDATRIAEIVSVRLRSIGAEVVGAAIAGCEYVFVLASATAGWDLIETYHASIRQSLRESVAKVSGAPVQEIAVRTGVGSSGLGVAALRNSHAEAVRALEVMRSMGRPDGVLSIDEAGSFALLTATTPADRRAFARRYIQPLLDYDRAHGSDYLDTLRAYFAAVGNAQRVADDMFLHISTIRYRLSRIEAIAGVSLKEEEDRLCLQIALRVADLNGAG